MNPKKLARKVLPARGARLAEEIYRKSRIYALQARYGFPARNLKIIGVTGTNGKTTTCNFINEMLKAAGHRTAMFTTAVIEMAGERKDNTIHRTVPLTAELLAFLRTAKQKQVDFVVLEVTSQALDQHKLVGIPIEVAVMTNLSQDHLDYHGSMEQYATTKARLFNGYARPKSVVLNRDDEWFEYFAGQAVGRVWSYGKHKDSSLRLSKVKAGPAGSSAEVRPGKTDTALQLTANLPGLFNLYNAAAAAACGLALGLPSEVAIAGTAALHSVPGRMEPIDCGQDFSVIVDYAHTPDALANVLGSLKQATKRRLYVVFGATGDRDKAKRPLMGRVAAQYADRIYLTDDETYTEDPDTIRRAVLEGIRAAKGAEKTTEIPDRRAAIAAAFKTAKKGDAVLLAGLGHQDYRAMGGKKQPWDERQVAREVLAELSYKQ